MPKSAKPATGSLQCECSRSTRTLPAWIKVFCALTHNAHACRCRLGATNQTNQRGQAQLIWWVSQCAFRESVVVSNHAARWQKMRPNLTAENKEGGGRADATGRLNKTPLERV